MVSVTFFDLLLGSFFPFELLKRWYPHGCLVGVLSRISLNIRLIPRRLYYLAMLWPNTAGFILLDKVTRSPMQLFENVD